ncbi:MAG TPA: phosphotransferase [Candidatus Limnocylindria bacterium]|nr:phosphotransferase [Candidatus Limnocylindria bacterium]
MLKLLPQPASETTQLGGPGRPWSIHYGADRAILRWNDASRWRAFGFSDDEAIASIEWLHAFLRDLAYTGFVAPRPMDDLGERSIAIAEGGIWELLSRVPGRAMGWSDDEIFEAGALLARFHAAAMSLPNRPQRPGAQPFASCEPAHPDAQAIRTAFVHELADLDLRSTTRGVIHGDATQSNVVRTASGTFHLVDYAIAYADYLLADIGSALWRNARRSPDAISYDAARAARFVGGYDSVRPLGRGASRAIVSFMKGRGLQLLHRLELLHGRDETVIQRLTVINAAQDELAVAIEAALS